MSFRTFWYTLSLVRFLRASLFQIVAGHLGDSDATFVTAQKYVFLGKRKSQISPKSNQELTSNDMMMFLGGRL
jgi:hypothetical protein